MKIYDAIIISFRLSITQCSSPYFPSLSLHSLLPCISFIECTQSGNLFRFLCYCYVFLLAQSKCRRLHQSLKRRILECIPSYIARQPNVHGLNSHVRSYFILKTPKWYALEYNRLQTPSASSCCCFSSFFIHCFVFLMKTTLVYSLLFFTFPTLGRSSC